MSGDFHDVRVTSRSAVADGVVCLELEATGGTPLPAWEPGAHVDVILPSGLVRQYSLCGPLGAPHYTISVLLEADGRGGSREIHESIWPGAQLRIHGPRNHFQLHQAQEYLFLAGGIGITPFIPMMRMATDAEVPWRLIYGGRSRKSMAFAEVLDASGAVRIVPEDELGLIDVAGELAASPNASVYVCGPPGLIDAVQAELQRLDRDLAHFERFVAAPVDRPVAGNRALKVQLGREGRVIEVPAEKTILAALLDAGVDVLFSCEEGTCGSCQVRVINGEVEHRDELLSAEERAAGDMLICVSRARSASLVLDVDEGFGP